MIWSRSMNVDTCSDVNLLRTYSHLLEDETRALTKRLSELAAENAQLRGEEQANLALEVGMLQEKLARREKELFGDSSERRGGDRKGSDKKRKPREGHGPHEQPELPIVEVVHELDEADCICPNCGGVLDEMADQYEESEEVDVIERRYVIKRHKRKKYSCCTCSSCIDTALGPDKLIEGGRYSLDFAVEVAVAKYADHMPLARQVAQMGRKGLQVTSQTLWDQIHALVAVLKPGYEALRQYVLAALVVGVDETRWRLLGSGKSSKWWVWSVTRPDAVAYKILPSRSKEAAQEVLGNYHGSVMADGMGAYMALRDSVVHGCRAGPDDEEGCDGPCFELATCMAHARRKVVKCEPHYPQVAEVLELFSELYAIERRVDEAEVASEEERLALRAELRRTESAPVLDAIYAWMAQQKVLPRSGLGKAIGYMVKYRQGLRKFLDDPRVPLDNNGTERSMRGPVLGRKNHQGSRSRRGTEASAVLYSFMETCKLVGVDPAAYLAEAARRAVRNPGAVLLPHQFKAKLAAAETDEASAPAAS